MKTHVPFRYSALALALFPFIASDAAFASDSSFASDSILASEPTFASEQKTKALTPTYHHTSQSDFGGVGLMQMPSGRSAPEGEFSVGYTANEDYRHYHASLQLMPWLEATLRYTQVPSKRYGGNGFGEDTHYTDKGIDVKFTLWEESYWLPETSIGMRDLGGTGLFDGEFIAASKRFGPVDLTMGVGWGYMGNSANLLGNKATDDCGRDTSYKGKGGSVDFERFFTGCAAVFGGVEYQTPWEPLTLKLEYDGNDYRSDFAYIDEAQETNFNVGALYRLGDWGNIRASFERGNTATLGFTLHTNFNEMKQVWVDSPKPAYAPAAEGTDTDWDKVAEDLAYISGFQKTKVYVDDNVITVEGNQSKYRKPAEAHDRAAAILANTQTPADTYRFVDVKNGLAVTTTDVDANAYRTVANQEYVGASIHDVATPYQASTTANGALKADRSERFVYGMSPTLQQSLGGAEDFYLFNLGVSGDAAYWFTDNLELGGSVYVNLYDNYDKFTHTVAPGDSTELKRVRTLVRQYISDNPVRLNNLQLTGFGQFFDDVYTQAYAGYLEMMYAGVGSELLYRPMGSNWAFGLDVNYVAQRDPNSQFGVFTDENYYDPIDKRNYSVQTGTVTGHASVYYRPEWSWFDDLTIKASAGRYLAEDQGVTLDVSKQFDSGVIAGAFVTKTDLSAEEFGEGSFNKGFYISIPFDVFTVQPSANRALIQWIPLTRDGGQMLSRKYHLYDMTNGRYPRSEFTNR
ncbi:hypothetical protein A1OS_23515 [Enterovibrio norvegicus]|uniref:YjbH domain-containing protein n=1 Tax=Enterovibrio norvegicus TaxID=188144 RepID=UPI0002FA5032|nr:YjbH domain-containing protein [Enterovibrio norvegicus]OEE49338.1 hypothetical protein A1OS_23515 [Enterovibrio norvegicus]